MKKEKGLRGLLALVLAVGFAVWAPGGLAVKAAGAEGTGRDDIPEGAITCETIEGLAEAIEASSGETIYLTKDIYVDDGWIEIVATKATTVDMGPYSIIVGNRGKWGNPFFDGPLEFTGTNRLFVLGSEGSLDFLGGTVLRAEGDGAVAIDDLNEYYINAFRCATIYVSGAGAVGYRSAAPLTEIDQCRIYADGGAVPVQYTGVVAVYFCLLENKTGGPVFQQTGGEAGITVNFSSVLQPAPEGIICPEITRMDPLYWSPTHIFQGDTEFDIGEYLPDPEGSCMFEYALPDVLLEREDVVSDWVVIDVPLEWDLSAYEAFDPNIAGIYEVVGTSNMPFDIPGIEFPLWYEQVVVVPPNKPWFTFGGMYLDEENGPLIGLDLMRMIEGADAIKLWCWEKTETGWKTKVDKLALGQAEFLKDGVWTMAVYNIDPEGVYRFKLEVVGGPMAGTSNYIQVAYSDGQGGDRDLGDRDPGDWGDMDEPDESSPPGKGNTPPAQPAPSAQPDATNQALTPATGTGQKPSAPALSPAADTPAAGQRFARQHLLDLMAANPKKVALFVGDIRIAFQTDALRQLLGEAESLNVDAGLTGSDLLHIRIWTNDTLVDFVEGGIEVAFAWPVEEPAGDIYLVSAENGAKIPATHRDGMLNATIEALGEYTIVSEAMAPAPQAEAKPPSPIATPQNMPDSGGWPYLAFLVPASLVAVGGVAVPVGLRWRRRRSNKQ